MERVFLNNECWAVCSSQPKGEALMKQMQRGITMIGFLITLTFVIFFAYCGMKIGPMYMEFFSVKKALAGIASDPEAANASKAARAAGSSGAS